MRHALTVNGRAPSFTAAESSLRTVCCVQLRGGTEPGSKLDDMRVWTDFQPPQQLPGELEPSRSQHSLARPGQEPVAGNLVEIGAASVVRCRCVRVAVVVHGCARYSQGVPAEARKPQ